MPGGHLSGMMRIRGALTAFSLLGLAQSRLLAAALSFPPRFPSFICTPGTELWHSVSPPRTCVSVGTYRSSFTSLISITTKSPVSETALTAVSRGDRQGASWGRDKPAGKRFGAPAGGSDTLTPAERRVLERQRR